jgi:tRNA U34 2-thiouridine synthase MnmA/TrmU
VAGEPPPAGLEPFRAEVQIRHRGTVQCRRVRGRRRSSRRGRRWQVETDEPVWAAAPGQAAVLYRGDVVLGGGRIARSEDSGS